MDSPPGSPRLDTPPAGRLPGAASRRWVLSCAVLLLILAFGNLSGRSLLSDDVFDFGHVPLFALLALAALRIARLRAPGMPARRAWWTAFGVVAALGVATELLQFFQPDRKPSFVDFARDLAGGGGALLCLAAFPRLAGGSTWASTPAAKRLSVLIAFVLIAVASLQLATTLGVLAARQHAMPTVAALDGSWWERRIVSAGGDATLTPGARPPSLARDITGPFARLDLRPSTYPGLGIDQPYPDWRGYRFLTFTVVSDLDVPLTLRVNDVQHDNRFDDRFNGTLTIRPGVNHVAIPLDVIRRAPKGREMDLAQIRTVLLFAYQPPAPVRVYLSPFRLE